MKFNIPYGLHASFLHSDEDDEIEEEKDTGCISESSPSGADEATTKDSRDNSDKNNKSFSHHRTSSTHFLAICDSCQQEKSPHELATSVTSRVKERFRESLSPSLVYDYEYKDLIAPFKTTEIVLGRKLGSGEFSHVYQVKSFRLDRKIEGSISIEQAEIRQLIKGREKYRDTKKSSFALKHLRPELVAKYKPAEYAQFASDLVQEAEFLSVLQHPNIIKLRGISLMESSGFQQGPKGYFLIIDRLEETLDNRIAKWKGATKPSRRSSRLLIKSTKKNDEEDGSAAKQLLSQQLNVVLQIAAAMVYLHEKNIIFRDLKPANVGFDVRGDAKLFDFGLARIMPSNGDSYNDRFEMSGAGSPRYMAPEVLRSEPKYNLKADVYTFNLVLWEVLALEKPFLFARRREALIDYVCEYETKCISFGLLPRLKSCCSLILPVKEGGRQDIKEEWPSSIKELLQMNFDISPDKRSSMKYIFETIRSELCQVRGGDNSRLRTSYLLRRRTVDSMVNQDVSAETNPRRPGGKLRSSITKFGWQFSI